jgi:hypothetical protein
MSNDNDLITLEDVYEIIRINKEIIDILKRFVGPTSVREVYTGLGMNWSAFKNALDRGEDLGAHSRGRTRRGVSGVEALELLTVQLKPTRYKSAEERAQAVRAGANFIERRWSDCSEATPVVVPEP